MTTRCDKVVHRSQFFPFFYSMTIQTGRKLRRSARGKRACSPLACGDGRYKMQVTGHRATVETANLSYLSIELLTALVTCNLFSVPATADRLPGKHCLKRRRDFLSSHGNRSFRPDYSAPFFESFSALKSHNGTLGALQMSYSSIYKP